MSFWRLVRRSLAYYWRTNIAVVLGVATAVAVLAGALLVGHSVRASLADLVEQRLGATDFAIVAPQFFRDRLAADLSADPRFAAAFRAAAPMIVAEAIVTDQDSGRRASHVKAYGVDERFWQFHGVKAIALESREAALSSALAREIGARDGAAVLVRVQRPSDIPLESLHARKDEIGRTLRLTTRRVLDAASLGDFSLDAGQGDVKAVFVPLARLREELEVGERVNTVLIAESAATPSSGQTLSDILKSVIQPADIGLSLRASDNQREVIVGSAAGLIDDRQAEVVRAATSGRRAADVVTYLANTMRVGNRDVPYSLVTGIDLTAIAATAAGDPGTPAIILNDWAAKDLNASVGDRLSMDFYVWQEPGELVTRSAEFRVAGTVPVETGSRDLAPDYPGISTSSSLRDWDPPFPLDLRRVRPIDEDYWNRFRTTPKAFIPIDVARKLWGSRYGSITSVRVIAPPPQPAASLVPELSAAVAQRIDPARFGLTLRTVRAEGKAASQGATDFGEYFVYFSFFLVVSALVLVALFFKLGVEQRVREVGLLRAVGLGPAVIRRVFTAEALLLSIVGSLLGLAGAVAYAGALISLLTTRWLDAIGTTALRLHVSGLALIGGGAGGLIAAVACIAFTLRGFRRISERSLLAGEIAIASSGGTPSRRTLWIALILALAGVALAGLSRTGQLAPAAGFFGAGALLLVAALTACAGFLGRSTARPLSGVPHLAIRNASYRPGRTVLSMSVIAAATFILVTVDAFRRDAAIATDDRTNGTGGYELMVQTLLPVVHEPNSPEGRDALNLGGLGPATALTPFRVRPGDDASCLNLYQPKNPRIIAPPDSFLTEGRFTFQSAAAATDAERANPWLLLNRADPDGAIPVIADANSMTYVLHRAVGDQLVLTNAGVPVTLRFVAALSDSIFQSELLMSDGNFRRLFPDHGGFQELLIDTTADVDTVLSEVERGLEDSGADAVRTGEYLASFHRVENTYLSTFQTLGGLGLLLGTVGLATVLLRNVLERRRELALLAAVGYRRAHFVTLATIENVMIVAGGLVIGAVSAAVAIAPAVAERGGRLPLSSGALLLLFAVFAVGMMSSVAAMAVATRTPLLDALRSE
jgi:ABC-type lipoprotein release transport system permease subunit